MRHVPFLLAALVLAACGTPLSAVAPEPTAPPPVAVEAPAPDAALPPAEVVVFEPAEAPPPEAPRGTVERRSVYPDPGFTEWALASGATVVYKQVEGAADVAVLAFASGDGPPRVAGGSGLRASAGLGERRVEGIAPTLDAALGALAVALADEPGAFTVVLVGPESPEAAEAAVGAALGRLRARAREGREPPAAGRFEVRAAGSRREAPALDVLAEAVAARLGASGTATPAVGARGDALVLAVSTSGAPDPDRLLAPFSDAEVERARAAAGQPSPRRWAALLADLYRERGERRPARSPAETGRRLALAQSVTAQAVNALADRLRQSPDRVLVAPDR